VLEVVDDALAVEEVVGDDKEVPVERLAPVASGLERLGALCMSVGSAEVDARSRRSNSAVISLYTRAWQTMTRMIMQG
jgi:hypothetical protein